MADPWGVLVARDHEPVKEALRKSNTDFFIPQIEYSRFICGRHIRALRPLLGEYILLVISSFWWRLKVVRGVRGYIVDDSGQPARVMPKELDYLRGLCVGGVYRPKFNSDFSYGQNVIAKEGPFAERVGHYEKHTRRGDVVCFNLFGREQRVVFKVGELVAA